MSLFGLVALAPGVALAQGAPPPYVVTIVAGHGGNDPGAIFPPDAGRPLLMEKDLTLPIALKLRDRLLADDVQVVMTRTADVTTSGEQRAAMAERAGAKVLVAVHVNSYYPDPSVRGVEAQYFSDPALAGGVADGLVLSLRDFQETVRTSKDREQDNILSMPGVIVEAGYLSNAPDRELLQTEAFQNAVADGIYQGILTYAPEIDDLKAQIAAYKLEQAKARAAQQAAPPGWLGTAGIGAGLGIALLLARQRARRRLRSLRRRPAYGVVRYR